MLSEKGDCYSINSHHHHLCFRSGGGKGDNCLVEFQKKDNDKIIKPLLGFYCNCLHRLNLRVMEMISIDLGIWDSLNLVLSAN